MLKSSILKPFQRGFTTPRSFRRLFRSVTISIPAVERGVQEVQRAEKWLERTFGVPCSVLSNVNMTAVLLQPRYGIGGRPEVWAARNYDGGCGFWRLNPVI